MYGAPLIDLALQGHFSREGGPAFAKAILDKIPQPDSRNCTPSTDSHLPGRVRIALDGNDEGLFRKILQALDERGISCQSLDGRYPPKVRKKRVEAFQTRQGDLFLIRLQAGGTGLNLTAADYVIHLDPWWNPAVEEQDSDRAHRIGQQKPVTVYRLITTQNIEKNLDLHERKRDLASDLLNGVELTGKLTNEDLIGLIRA